ncbi:MAG: acyl-CoA dehydratase activase, partial [Planctomycetota bacterium]
MFLGIDIGSLYLSFALLDENGNLIRDAYEAHRGNPLGVLKARLEEVPLSEVVTCAKTGSGASKISGIGQFIDPVVAQLDGTKVFTPDIRNIIAIGAGSFTLIRANERSEYLKHTSNSACASGTGAFLDQQALRLKFRPEELHLKAECATNCPSVATRCAVFAKSDIIHLQQEGNQPEDIAAGLCRGLGRSAIDQLLQGRTISGKTIMIGGVALNSQVVKAVEERLEIPVEVPGRPELVAAIGAAHYAMRSEKRRRISLNNVKVIEDETSGKRKVMRAPLELKLSDYPAFDYHDFKIDENETEAALVEPLESGKTYRVSLGIDIGSTSTKCTFVTPEREVLAIYYRATAGNPIQAVKYLFTAIRETERATGAKFDVIGAGTTGSGRKFIRKVVAADIERDEITAHAKAATFIDPDVDTIIELGGQDAKFTQLQDGIVYNSIMNYVCAAGTGSFIEEQSKKLGISIWDYADFVMGKRAPFTSDRCTVYMERDLEALMAAGFSKKEIAAAVLFSVRDNYLNKVVGGLHIGEHVYFQGATARNKALVAAFEQELGKPIAVSPYCHVTGALGISLMILEEVNGKSTFRGLGFADEESTTTKEICEFCNNHCNITVVESSGDGAERVKWGFKCGRDDEDKGPRRKKLREYDLFRVRAQLQRSIGARKLAAKRGTVAAPRSLTFYGYLPFWRAFFSELGYELKISAPSSNETLVAGERLKTAEICAPVVLGLGHAKAVFDLKADYYFFPYMIREQEKEGFSDSHFCPHVQSHPAFVRALFPDIPQNRLLQPVLEMTKPERLEIGLLMKEFGPKLGIRRDEARNALKAAKAAMDEFYARCLEEGRKKLSEIERDGKMGIVVVGRPYNTVDKMLSLDLPKKIAEKGITVFPLDFIPLDLKNTCEDWPNMYWTYGQKILAAADTIRDHPNLFSVFLTNFSCGPDSYLLSYFKRVMAGRRKPHVTLQLDAHGADAGYLTR